MSPSTKNHKSSPTHVREAKRLYRLGYSVINIKIYYNQKKNRKSFVTPSHCTDLTYEECSQFIGSSWSVGNTICDTTNGIMLLTGVRKGERSDLKHTICIDVDNQKEDEIDGMKFIKGNRKLFKNAYVEKTGNGGNHYIFHLKDNMIDNPIYNRGSNDRFEFNDDIYSIDVLANSKKVVLSPSSYMTPDGLKTYESEMRLEEMNNIPSILYQMCNLTTDKKNTTRKEKKLSKVSKLEIKDDYTIYEDDDEKTMYIKLLLERDVFIYIKDYSEWLKIGLAIKNEIPNSFDLFHMISKQNIDKYKDEYDCENLFNGLKRSQTKTPIRWGTLVNIAKSKMSKDEYKSFMNDLNELKNSTSSEVENDTEVRQLLSGAFTDVDLSKYMYNLFGDEFKVFGDYIYFWNGHRWLKNTSSIDIHKKINDHLYKHLKDHADTIYGSNDNKLDQYQKILKKLLKLRSNSSKKGIIEEFKMAVNIGEDDIFDLNPDLLGFKNGVYELNNLKFRESRKSDYISLIINYDYHESPKKDMDKINQFIDQIMPIKEERDYLLKALSSCLDGRTLANILIMTGSGRNGKDTLLSFLLKASLGRNFFYYNNNTVITGNSSSGANQEKANMDKKRCVLFSEPNKDCTLKNNTLKELSGGNQLNARGLYMTSTDTVLHNTTIIQCNKIPQLDNVDEAISHRLVVIPFRALFRKPEDIALMPKDTEYVYEVNNYYKEDEFLNDMKLPFINVLLKYYKEFKDDGRVLKGMPESIKKLSSAYMADSDNLLNWLNDAFEKTNNPKDYVKIIDLYDLFRSSEYYNNMSKKDKRGMNKKKLIEEFKDNPTLKSLFRDRIKINGVDIRQCIICYKPKEDDLSDHSDDDY